MISATELASLEKACSHCNINMYAVIDELERILIGKVSFSDSSKGYDLYIPKKLYNTFKKPSIFARDLTQYLEDHGYTVSCKKKYCTLDSMQKMRVLKSIKYWPGIDADNDIFVIITIEW